MAEISNSYLIDLKHNGDFSGAPNGDLALIKGLDNLKQALYHRLITVPGALVHRPEYGVGVQRWQNKLGSLDNQKTLAIRIKEQFELDSRVQEVTSVKIENINDDGTFEVTYVAIANGEQTFDETTNPFEGT